MSMHFQQARLRTRPPDRHLRVFRAADFRVIDGVNEGDPLSDAADLLHEDVYALRNGAVPARLSLAVPMGAGPLQVGRDSAVGRPGAQVFLDCLVTFIGSTGEAFEALVVVETDPEGLVSEVYLAPLAALEPDMGYTLIAIDRAGAAARFAGGVLRTDTIAPVSAGSPDGPGSDHPVRVLDPFA